MQFALIACAIGREFDAGRASVDGEDVHKLSQKFGLQHILRVHAKAPRFEVSKESWNDDSYAYGNKLVIRAIDNDTSRTPLIDILIPDHFEGLTEQEAVGLSERIVKILEAFPL